MTTENQTESTMSTAPAVGSSELVRLLDECATAMCAARHEVTNPDLAIALRHRAEKCRSMIIDLTWPNEKLSDRR